MGRSKKAVKNVLTGVTNKVLTLVLSFATRTVFIRLLGAEYIGVGSLYSNILSVLSLAELGLGNVLTFYLYSALKDQDERRIIQLTREFKKIYRIIILIVLGIGLALIPFLPMIINSPLDRKELIVYYLLYLTNSVASYFVIYRTMVINADQKSYITNNVQTASTVIMHLLQIVYLLINRDYLGFLIIRVLCTVASNVTLNTIALKKYPYLKKRADSDTNLINRKDLFGNIKATFLFKVSDTILDQTDSIIISVMFGTALVGYYSNYYTLILYISAIAGIIANGLLASFGNLNAEGDMQRSYSMFRVAMMCFAIFGTWCTACFACIVQDFIPIWVGAEYLMEESVVLAILAVFYLRMVTNTVWMYRSSMGLFKEVQYINIAAAALNIVSSVLLGKLMGVAGVVAATALSRLTTSFWFEGKVVFKRFGKPVRIYYLRQLKDFCLCCAVVATSVFLCSHVPVGGIAGMVIKIAIASVITGAAELAVYYKTAEFKIMLAKFRGLIKKG